MEVTEHRAEVCTCRGCRKKVKAAFPEGVVAPVQYGERIQAMVIYLHTEAKRLKQREAQGGRSVGEKTLNRLQERYLEILAAGGFTNSAVGDLADERTPSIVAERLWQPLADRPQAGLQALALVAAAMLVPLVLRARPGGPRVIAATLWVVALSAVLVATAADTASALGAAIPVGVIVIGWAVRPWRSLRRRPPARTSATLRGPIV